MFALSGLAGASQVIDVPKAEFKVQWSADNRYRYIEVKGTKERLLKVFDDFQGRLWPDYKEHMFNPASQHYKMFKDYRDQLEKIKNGTQKSIILDSSMKQTLEACDYAVKLNS
jgi:hypothetical protein